MMAEASAPFFWGSGGSKDSPSSRRKLADALLKSGMDFSPVQHWTQGLARMAQALVGGYESGQIGKEEKASNEAIANALAGTLGGSSAPAAAAPAAAPSMAGGGAARSMAMPNISPEMKTGIAETATALGISPVDLATAISYETGGTFNPTQAGPTTKWGQHRGLIQFGEPQARQFGVDWSNPVGSQLGANGAVANYLRNAGVKPGMGMMDIYSAINAGGVGLYNRSDAAAGGAPGTVADKVNNQMAGHRAKAMALFGGDGSGPMVKNLPAVAQAPIDPASVTQNLPAALGQPVPSGLLQNLADVPDVRARNASAETGAPGFAIPQGAPTPPAPMTAQTFNMIQEGQPLDPVFQSEGIGQPWMGTALAPAEPQMVQAPMPPARPSDLAMADPRADMPAPGAVPAVGQMPAAAIPDLSNENDAGSRATAGGRSAVAPAVGADSAFSSLARALTGAPASAQPISPAVQQVAQAVAPQAAPAAPANPMAALAIALARGGHTGEAIKIATSLNQPVNGVTMGDRLVDPRNGRVIADFSQANGGRSRQYGMTPIYGTDAQGNAVMLQVGERGDAVQTRLPDGVKLAPNTSRVDLGTSWGVVDRSGNIVSTIPKDLAGAERAKVEGKAAGEAATSLNNAIAQGEQVLGTIDQVRNHPGRSQFGATGAGTTLPIIGDGLPGTKGRDFVGLVDQLKGQAFLDAFDALKGGGAISETEGKVATQARARLDRAQSKEGFDAALSDLEAVIRRGIENARKKAGGSGTIPAAPASRGGGQTRSGVKWSVE